MSLLDFLPKGGGQKKLSKEERVETKRQQELVREVIYPIFLKNAKSIRDARQICQNFIVGLDACFYLDAKKYQEQRSSDPLGSLNMVEALKEGKENTTEWLLIQSLKDEKVTIVKALIEGLGKEIQRLVEKDMDKPIDQLKTEFL